MYQVYETETGKRRYSGKSFNFAALVKEALEKNGVSAAWAFIPN